MKKEHEEILDRVFDEYCMFLVMNGDGYSKEESDELDKVGDYIEIMIDRHPMIVIELLCDMLTKQTKGN